MWVRLFVVGLILGLGGCCRDEDIPRNVAKLNSAVAKDRNQAALKLARCGAKADQAVPLLAQLLYDDNVGVQSAAAYALRKIDTPRARKIMERIDRERAEARQQRR
jgi:HEAT repeat protein